MGFEGSWLHAAGQINSIDPEVWRRSDRVAVGTRRLLHESGDALAAQQAGVLDGLAIAELHEAGAAAHVCRAAREQGIGGEITDFQISRTAR